ncbi:hypothetical protein K7X08_016043 [Anisodus acutangulus]|uniref:Uncharacterized protein n=1 Tax=Anisodus acutangulus TaxID=402998 RepID=A0A9Q1QZN2_9SOLA|nr:hypothetical protein K7X08_016043 [Anisodus acutangulus]
MAETKLLSLMDQNKVDKVRSRCDMRKRNLEDVKPFIVMDIDTEIAKALELEKMSIESSKEIQSSDGEEDVFSRSGCDEEEDLEVEDDEPIPIART